MAECTHQRLRHHEIEPQARRETDGHRETRQYHDARGEPARTPARSRATLLEHRAGERRQREHEEEREMGVVTEE